MYKQSWDRPTFMDPDTGSDQSSVYAVLGRCPALAEFEVDYIISFVAGANEAAPTLEEALAKLHQLDASGSIWTIRCQLTITIRDLIVVNRQTGEEMEKFPLQMMQKIMERESRDPKESFSNLFVFVVNEEGQQPEMHIFQSVMTPSSRIVEEVRRIKDGRHQAIGVATANAARNSRNSGEIVNSRFTIATDSQERNLSLQQAEREVYVLNRCFDDIELFVSRIQSAVDSFQELQRRQKDRKKKDKKMGDGLLISRSRMPPFEDFIDIFKKFKLALNLQAHLQDFIHDPNASELVHYLFTPLIFATKASPPPSDTAEPDDMLISHVVSPLLTKDAVTLLKHCLNSKQSEFWRSLGDAWTTPRETWTAYVPPFTPRFSDNYIPALQDFQAALGSPSSEAPQEVNGASVSNVVTDQAASPRKVEARPMETFQRENEANSHRRQEESSSSYFLPPSSSSPASPISESSSELSWEKRQQLFRADVISNGGRIMQAIAARKGANEKELTVQKGEFLEVLQDSRNWWKMRNMDADVGHVPYTFLRSLDTTDFKEPEGAQRRASIPVPPPPPPPAPPAIDPYVSNINLRRKDEKKEEMKRRSQPAEHAEELANELRAKISLGTKQQPRVVKRPKAVNITQESTSEQVADWLRVKGFSERTLIALNGKKGFEMFQLKRYEMDEILTKEEASRLDSLLTVQKNICGYGTRSSLELRAILKSRKQLAEVTDDL